MSDRRLRHDLARLLELASRLQLIGELYMKTVQDLVDKITELAADESAFAAREQAIVDALTAHVAELQAAVDAGTPIDTTAQIAQVQAIIDAIPTPPSTSSTSGTAAAS